MRAIIASGSALDGASGLPHLGVGRILDFPSSTGLLQTEGNLLQTEPGAGFCRMRMKAEEEEKEGAVVGSLQVIFEWYIV